MMKQDPVVAKLCERHGEDDAEVLIVRLCRELVAECSTESGPSPLNVLGSVRNVRECHSGHIEPGSGCSGYLIRKNGGYEVIVNADEPEERQWFSFAHEIVHTYFREVCPNVTHPSPEEEHLCDVGAAELTMPLERFTKEMQGHVLSLGFIEELQKEFHVSFKAAGRRALHTTDEAACLFVAALARTKDQDQKNVGLPILRLVSWKASLTWPDKGNYKNRPIDDEECIIAESFANLDARNGRGSLGVPYNSAVYDVETRAYEYPRGGVANYRQVVALAKAS
jgi:hypothetical protein